MGTWTLDVDGSQATWSQGLYKLFGFEPNSVVPTLDLMRSVVHPEDRGKFEMSVGFAANRSALRIDYRLIRPDGTLRWVTGKSQIHFLRDGSPKLLLGVVVDHTDDHEQQNKLNIEETYIKLVSAHLGGHRWLADSQGKMLDLSVWKSVTGAEPDAASDWSQRLAAVHPADRKQYSNSWRTSLAQHVAFEAAYRCKTNDGRYRRIFSRALPVLDETGTIQCWVGHTLLLGDQPEEPTGTKAISGHHVRAARAYLEWSAHDLAEKSGIAYATIRRIESGETPLKSANRAQLSAVFAERGITFIEDATGNISMVFASMPIALAPAP